LYKLVLDIMVVVVVFFFFQVGGSSLLLRLQSNDSEFNDIGLYWFGCIIEYLFTYAHITLSTLHHLLTTLALKNHTTKFFSLHYRTQISSTSTQRHSV